MGSHEPRVGEERRSCAAVIAAGVWPVWNSTQVHSTRISRIISTPQCPDQHVSGRVAILVKLNSVSKLLENRPAHNRDSFHFVLYVQSPYC